MATPASETIDAEHITLARATAQEYCEWIRRTRNSGIWWYLRGLVASSALFRPFADAGGRWWWHVKPGFAWPVDFFTPIDTNKIGRLRGNVLGRQYPVADQQANSHVHLNVIHDLTSYGLSSIEKRKRRHGIRKALRSLRIGACDPTDRSTTDQACEVWNSHVERTGWNTPMDADEFHASWTELARCPGTTTIVARDPALDDKICGWLIARVIDDTVFIDTIASHSDRMAQRPNDAIIFLCLASAAAQGVAHGHYALKSRLESLEAFKQALGFQPYAFPVRLEFRLTVAPLLRLLRPRTYRRLLGDETWYRDPSDECPPDPHPTNSERKPDAHANR